MLVFLGVGGYLFGLRVFEDDPRQRVLGVTGIVIGSVNLFLGWQNLRRR